MNGSNGPLPLAVRAILNERGYEKTCLPLEAVAQRVEGIHRNIRLKLIFYKWSSLFILILIPLISTLLSIFVTKNLTGVWVDSFAYSLTILTLLNSIFRPSFRFKELCEMGLGVQELKDEFVTRLENLTKIDEGKLHMIREDCDRRLLPYEKRMIALFLPEASFQPARKRAA